MADKALNKTAAQINDFISGVGGGAVDSKFTWKSTSGIGTSTGVAHQFLGGNNGNVTIATMLNSGQFIVGNTNILDDNGTVAIKEQRPGKTTTRFYAEAPVNFNHIFIEHDGTNGLLAADGTVQFNGGAGAVNAYDFQTRIGDEYVSKLVLTNSGYIGLGVPIPEGILHAKSIDSTYLIIECPNAKSAGLQIRGDSNSIIWQLIKHDSDQSFRFFDQVGGVNAMVIKSNGGGVGLYTANPTSKLHVVGLLEYADNAAAITAGLTAGAFYRTADVLKVVH